MPANPKSSINPLHAAFPQLFKRTGEVKRHPNAPRFSKKISLLASKLAPTLGRATSITIETPVGLFVLTRGMTQLIQGEDSTIEALIINGWNVTVTTPDNEYLLPVTLVQTALEMMEE